MFNKTFDILLVFFNVWNQANILLEMLFDNLLPSNLDNLNNNKPKKNKILGC